jgi:hypothetical protein
MRRALAATLFASAPHVGQADTICDFYFNCCQQLVGAYEEAGVPAQRVSEFEYTCNLHETLAAHPAAQAMFCEGAWEGISREAFRHFTQGRIGFYPDVCFSHPLEDPEDIAIPIEEMFPEDAFPEAEAGE